MNQEPGERLTRLETKLDAVLEAQHDMAGKLERVLDRSGLVESRLTVLEQAHAAKWEAMKRLEIEGTATSLKVAAMEMVVANGAKNWEKVADLIFKVAATLLGSYLVWRMH